MRAELDAIKRAVARGLNKEDFEFSSHRSIIDEIVGKGYGHTESGERLLRMHAQEVVELILKKAGEDVLKQIELAAAVKNRLTDVNPNKDLPVALAIVESVKSWLKEIKNKFKGRFPNDIRSLYQGVHQAVSLADAKRSDVARLLGTSSRLLKEGRARFWAFIEGKIKDLVVFRGKMRSEQFPEEWAEFIVETWCSDRCTRASERSSDEMRNPNTKKDPEWHRLHFLEKKILTIIDIINEEGKKKLHAEYEYADGQSRPDGFKASYNYITTLRPFFVVPPKCATTMSFLTSSSTSRSRSARTYMRGLQRGSLSTLRAFAFAMFDWRR